MVEQVSLLHADDLGKAVVFDIFLRHAHGHGVQVDGQHVARAHMGGGDGEDARAGAEVDDLLAGAHVFLDEAHAHAGGLVGAGAKSHAGVEFDDVVARLRFVIAPAGLDDHVPDPSGWG